MAVKALALEIVVEKSNGSPEDTDLERIYLAGPRIKHLRDLFVIESGARSEICLWGAEVEAVARRALMPDREGL